MGEHPIIFQPWGVRAIMADPPRKTMTRRIVLWPLHSESDGAKRRIFGERDVDLVNELLSERQKHPNQRIVTPFGRPGSRLWVRETHRFVRPWTPSLDEYLTGAPEVMYYADDNPRYRDKDKWRPSIHMPRWAARLFLRVESVRVERLQEITQYDAKAEGVEYRNGKDSGWRHPGDDFGLTYRNPRNAFAATWDSLQGKRPKAKRSMWDDNDYVWVYEFSRIER